MRSHLWGLASAVVSTIAVLGLAGSAAAQTVTVDERPDRWVVQHVDGAGQLEVAGAVTGSGAVEARVVEAVGGAVVVPWAVVDPAPQGGMWSGVVAAIPA
ncbi:MAG: hypothetical protein AAFY88_02185, partial [Acidobacteriota bacterium]